MGRGRKGVRETEHRSVSSQVDSNGVAERLVEDSPVEGAVAVVYGGTRGRAPQVCSRRNLLSSRRPRILVLLSVSEHKSNNCLQKWVLGGSGFGPRRPFARVRA